MRLTYRITSAASSAVALYCTDLASGPKTGGENGNGAYVTLYGRGFGATRGTGSVTLGGGAVAAYKSWSDTKLVVELGAAVATGNFTVTNNAGQSTTGCIDKPYGASGNDFTVRAGAIYFVSPTGVGSGTAASPFSPTGWYSSAGPGAIFYFRAGVFNGVLGGTGQGGETRSFTIYSTNDGDSATNHVAMVGYPGETATLNSGAANSYGGITCDGSSVGYVTVANLSIIGGFHCFNSGANTANNTTAELSGAHDLRFVGNDCTLNYNGTNSTATAMVCLGNTGNRIHGNTIHNNQTGAEVHSTNHMVYAQAGTRETEISWNTFRDLKCGNVIQVHQDLGNYHYYNVNIHDNYITPGTGGMCRAIGLVEMQSDSYGSVYNNVMDRCNGSDAGAVIAGTWKWMNNTWYQCSGGNGLLLVNFSNTKTVELRNNIMYSDGSAPYVGYFNGASSAQVTASHNNYFNNGAGPAETGKVTTNPLFTNAAAQDFTLQSGSPCRDVGYNTSATVNHDRNGVPRPQGAAMDMGAYEYTT